MTSILQRGVGNGRRRGVGAVDAQMQARYLLKKQKQREKREKEEAKLRARPVVTVTLAAAAGLNGSVRLTIAPLGVSGAASTADVTVELPWADGYALVTEEGWTKLGVGNFKIRRFHDRQQALSAAWPLWCCWVLYREEGASYQEIASGGVGFACYAIRNFVRDKMSAVKLEARRASMCETAAIAAIVDPAENLSTDDAWYAT